MEDKKIKVMPIVREGSWLSNITKNHDGIVLFTGTGVTYSVPVTPSGNMVNVLEGESLETIKWLERELGLDDNALSPNRQRDKNFWMREKITRVKLTKDGAVLNLLNPIDYIKYLVLKCNQELIAPSWESRFDKGSYKFALVDNDIEVRESSKKADLMRDCYMEFGKISDSEAKMKGILKIYFTETKSVNKVPTKTTKEFLKGEINKVIDTNPKKFLAIIQDADFGVKADISEAITVGYIEKVGKARYQFKDMIDEQFTYDELVSYLKDKSNSDRYLILKQSIK
jgi:hypothetical protein